MPCPGFFLNMKQLLFSVSQNPLTVPVTGTSEIPEIAQNSTNVQIGYLITCPAMVDLCSMRERASVIGPT